MSPSNGDGGDEEEEEKKEEEKLASSNRKKTKVAVPAKYHILNTPSSPLISFLKSLDRSTVGDPRIEMFYHPNTTLHQLSFLYSSAQYFSPRSQTTAYPAGGDAAVDAALVNTFAWIQTQGLIAAGVAAPLAGSLGTNAIPLPVVFEAGTQVWNWIHYLHSNRVNVFQLPAGAAAAAAHVPVERLQVRYVMGNHTSEWAPILI